MARAFRGARPLAAVLVLSLSIGTSGCGLTVAQKAAIGQFSRATSAVGETTSDELAKMRDGTIQANISTLVIIGEDRPAPGDPTPRSALITPTTVERQFTIEATSRIGHAARALRTYGDLLQALVEDTQAKELRGAADSFLTNLKAVPGVSLQDTEADAITAAVYAIGRVIVEVKKAKAVRTIVPAVGPHVNTITGLLAREFDPDQNGSLASTYRGAAERLRGEGAEAYRKATSTAERAAILPAWEYGRMASLRSDEIHKRSSRAISGIQKTHAYLVTALKDDRWTVADVKAAVSEFETELKALATVAAELAERSKLLQFAP
jgi:hypothetical protein